MAGSGKNEQWESMMEVVADNAALLTAVGAVAAVSILYACTGAPANTSTATTDTTDTKSPEDVAGGATALADKKKRKRAKKKAAAVANEVEEVVKESSDDESQDANKETVETAASKKKKKKNKKKANSGGDAPEEVSSGGQVKVNKKSSTQKAGSGAKTSKADAALKQALAEAQRDEREAAKERRKKAEAEEEAWESVSTTKSKPRKKKSTAAPESDASDAGKSKVLVKIPTDKIGVIIGPGGATLHKLQDATGTRINIPQSDAAKNYEREKTVTIEGLQEGTFACSKAIKDLAAKGFSTITHGEFSEASVQVFADYMSVIIGKEGATIRAIENTFGVKLGIPPGVSRNDTKPIWLKITGPKPGIDAAKKDIKQLLRTYYSKAANPELAHAEMTLEGQQLKDLIGHKGNTIKSIQGETKTKIFIPKTHSLNPNVVIVGAPANVTRAKGLAERALQRAITNRQERYAASQYDAYDDDDYDYDEDY
eukprot:m.1420253 g.1420253  ORF g.1420253 m.1420253 type:complete len:484 (-) comp25045_c1_seq17:371-1822(-)